MNTPKDKSMKPWVIRNQDSYNIEATIEAFDKIPIACVYSKLQKQGTFDALPIAKRIIGCVNTYEELVEALERITRVAGVELEHSRPDVIEQARTALSKAKEVIG